ncbi:MAG: hypothetical protein ACK5GN_12445 [Pseudomonadota bacterium]
MQLSKMHLLTILTEESLIPQVSEKLHGLGVESFVVRESQISPPAVHGKKRSDCKRLRIEALVSQDLADIIINWLHAESFSEDSLIFFVSEVLTSSDSGTINHSNESRPVAREERWGDYLITL